MLSHVSQETLMIQLLPLLHHMDIILLQKSASEQYTCIKIKYHQDQHQDN